jgi:hypothetical protein
MCRVVVSAAPAPRPSTLIFSIGQAADPPVHVIQHQLIVQFKSTCLRDYVICGCVQGGGFCGSRTKSLNLDLSAYDGLQLRVRGDGQIFKFNIKTVGFST